MKKALFPQATTKRRPPSGLVMFLVGALTIPPLYALTPEEVWPAQVQVMEAAALKEHLAGLDRFGSGLPPAVEPAVRFQKVFLQMVSGSPQISWRTDLEKLAQAGGADPVTRGVAEVARVWLARVETQDLDRILHKHYREQVAFPETLAQVDGDIPKNLKSDPWGDPWIYKSKAPAGFTRLARQRYQLGPSRYPLLAGFEEATRHRTFSRPVWKVFLREADGGRALEFRSLAGDGTNALIQPGDPFQGRVVLYNGTTWALMADRDQLFTVAVEK